MPIGCVGVLWVRSIDLLQMRLVRLAKRYAGLSGLMLIIFLREVVMIPGEMKIDAGEITLNEGVKQSLCMCQTKVIDPSKLARIIIFLK